MSDSPAELSRLFQWVQAVVVHPDGAEAGVASAEVQELFGVSSDSLEELLVPSKTLTPLERIGVYSSMYPLRMRSALSVDYPVLKETLGEHHFNHLVDEYVQVHPSRHPNLNQLGRHLPVYLKSRKDMEDNQFLAELAELELAITYAFDAAESPPLSVDDLTGLPPERWADAIFHPIEALQLRAFRFPVNRHFQAVRDEKPPPLRRRAQSYVAIYRRDYRVWRSGMDRSQYRMLRLLTEGKSVGEALMKEASGSDIQTLAAQLRNWFRDWVEQGFFTRIEIEEGE